MKFNQKQIEAIGAKFLLAFYSILDVEDLERRVFFYYYPKFSEIMKYLIVLYLVTFDPANLISHFVALFILLMILYNEQWYAKIHPILTAVFKLDEINPYINDAKAALIKTVRQDSIEKNNELLKNYANNAKNKDKKD
jgi:hypothetical protein